MGLLMNRRRSSALLFQRLLLMFHAFHPLRVSYGRHASILGLLPRHMSFTLLRLLLWFPAG